MRRKGERGGQRTSALRMSRAGRLCDRRPTTCGGFVESGDELAIELEWTGVLAIPVLGLPAGSEMKAFVAMFLTFRDGRIVSQRNYDCYPPFAAEGGAS